LPESGRTFVKFVFCKARVELIGGVCVGFCHY
jgi:hypothetical protein